MKACILIMCMVFASGVLQAQPGVVYTSDQPDRRAGETGQPVVVYTGEQLDPLSDRYCPYCVFKLQEAERAARERRLKAAASGALLRFDSLRERRNRD